MTTYFKLLNKSSSFFIEKAKENRSNAMMQRYYILSSLIHSWLLLEAYINHISDALSSAKLDRFSKAVLQHKALALNENGDILEIGSNTPTLKRALFILRNFSKVDVDDFRQSNLWKHITWAEDFRNQLIHPKQFRIEYLDIKKAEQSREYVVDFIKKMNRSVFHKNITLN